MLLRHWRRDRITQRWNIDGERMRQTEERKWKEQIVNFIKNKPQKKLNNSLCQSVNLSMIISKCKAPLTHFVFYVDDVIGIFGGQTETISLFDIMGSDKVTNQSALIPIWTVTTGRGIRREIISSFEPCLKKVVITMILCKLHQFDKVIKDTWIRPEELSEIYQTDVQGYCV